MHGGGFRNGFGVVVVSRYFSWFGRDAFEEDSEKYTCVLDWEFGFTNDYARSASAAVRWFASAQHRSLAQSEVLSA
jgi:hypothetical protein